MIDWKEQAKKEVEKFLLKNGINITYAFYERESVDVALSIAQKEIDKLNTQSSELRTQNECLKKENKDLYATVKDLDRNLKRLLAEKKEKG